MPIAAALEPRRGGDLRAHLPQPLPQDGDLPANPSRRSRWQNTVAGTGGSPQHRNHPSLNGSSFDGVAVRSYRSGARNTGHATVLRLIPSRRAIAA